MALCGKSAAIYCAAGLVEDSRMGLIAVWVQSPKSGLVIEVPVYAAGKKIVERIQDALDNERESEAERADGQDRERRPVNHAVVDFTSQELKALYRDRRAFRLGYSMGVR